MNRRFLYLITVSITFALGYVGVKNLSLQTTPLALIAVMRPPQGYIPTQQLETKQSEIKAPKASNLYHTARTIILNVDNRGSKLKAQLETLRAGINDILDDREQVPYWSRLVITNIKTGRIIYEETFEEFFVSMYKRDLNNDSQDELILTMTPGAVSYHLMVFDFRHKNARLILNKPYRADAVFVKGEDKSTDILITDAELGTGPYFTTRYVWRGSNYQAIKTIPYQRRHLTTH